MIQLALAGLKTHVEKFLTSVWLYTIRTVNSDGSIWTFEILRCLLLDENFSVSNKTLQNSGSFNVETLIFTSLFCSVDVTLILSKLWFTHYPFPYLSVPDHTANRGIVYLRVRSFGMIWIRIYTQYLRIMCIKDTDGSLFRWDLAVPLMHHLHHDPSDLAS